MITEDQLEQQCLGWFREGGWESVFGPDIAHDGAAPERANYREVVLVGRLTRSLARLNPGVPAPVLDDAVQRLLKLDHPVTEAEKHSTLRRILDKAVVSEGVADIFALAGLKKPNIGLLSKEFLEDVRNMPAKNLAVELLEKLLRDEIKAHLRTNVVLQKKFGDRLLESLRKYHNRAIETAQVIEEMIRMATDVKDAISRNEQLGLSPEEVAFYDALAERPEVLREMGDITLKKLATELTEQLRKSTTVDWQVRDTVRAQMRILIKRLLRKYKYPPEGQDEAVVRVLEQAEALAEEWSKN